MMIFWPYNVIEVTPENINEGGLIIGYNRSSRNIKGKEENDIFIVVDVLKSIDVYNDKYLDGDNVVVIGFVNADNVGDFEKYRNVMSDRIMNVSLGKSEYIDCKRREDIYVPKSVEYIYINNNDCNNHERDINKTIFLYSKKEFFTNKILDKRLPLNIVDNNDSNSNEFINLSEEEFDNCLMSSVFQIINERYLRTENEEYKGDEENMIKNEELKEGEMDMSSKELVKKIKECKEKMKNNLSKFQMIIYKFIIYILTIGGIIEMVLNNTILKRMMTVFNGIFKSSKFIQQLELQYHQIIKALPNNWYIWCKSRIYSDEDLKKNEEKYLMEKGFYLRILNVILSGIIDNICYIIILGVVVIYQEKFYQFLYNTNQSMNQEIIVTIKWLMNSIPAGLKLNTNLSYFLGTFYLFYYSKWQLILSYIFFNIRFSFLSLIYCTFLLFGLLGFRSCSLFICFLFDIFRLFTFHLISFYNGSSKIYYYQLNMLIVFWRLFRGKKNNVLRNRIDSCNFDINQLLLGTIIFTIIFFLFPTIIVYYAFFLFLFLCLTILNSLFQLLLFFFHFFPFGSVFSYFFFPSNLHSNGISFHIFNHKNFQSDHLIFVIQKKDYLLSDIITNFLTIISNKIFKNVNFFTILNCLLTGKNLTQNK
eukprot:TRINITY_DN9512_c0_g1_i1.p1 TRINITY_DN9512_c0_g1~~TRINITY_DN9512_c0_g1_i1.p1  ORF type:complete len:647 (+),score=72.90 TRINITY_DN9512_c0_g1_i1:29-1969(+)